MTEEINGVANAPVRNGHRPHPTSGDPLPGISLRALIAERNWAALAGLALISVGVLYVLGISLWAISLLAIGGWLAFDGWQTYHAAGKQWVGHSRNRAFGGALIALVGLIGMVHLNGWGLLLLGVAGWLGYDTWQAVERSGGIWSQRARNRAFAAGIIGLIALFGLVNVGSAWSWLLVIAGGYLIYRHLRAG